ncbi:glutamate 5-kinase [Litorimonas sp. RW-G-Af-16]|uniref:glutamate 5-kinase n=1 Tax=Litorimonas sp. RW-G-Af-16 TaxID=3241168 RepID=UPI00390CBE42
MSALPRYNRLVIKIGSAILVDAETGLLRSDWLDQCATDIKALRDQGTQIVLVSSGAIALGRKRLALSGKLSLSEKQACASVGQSRLTQAYERALGAQDIIAAQALLTLRDTENRLRWLNARSSMETLIGLGAIPVINENDTVATDEIRYGDNDRLAARAAQMLGADGLILLSDIDGLYTADPRTNTDAKHLPEIEALTDDIMAMGAGANTSAAVGTGGMATKLLAAKIATQAGCEMIICDGRKVGALGALVQGAKHSRFLAQQSPKNARAQWIAGTLKPRGAVQIDAGAEAALARGKSLLAAGVTRIIGTFGKGDAVTVRTAAGQDIARGLIAYSSTDATQIVGVKSSEIERVLGYQNGTALIHRDNLAML